MQLLDIFFKEYDEAREKKIQFVIPIGTIEYHTRHLSSGTDTFVITGVLRELEKRKEIIVCPPVWYGVASYAVAGPESGTIHVDADAYEQYIYCILKSLVYGGIKNIYCIPHHQTENAGLMPMTLACHKAAKKVIMEYLEDTQGLGWWGRDSYADYYENCGTGDDPFSYIKVIPLLGAEVQEKVCGFDHAGKVETSMMLSLYPERVDLSRRKDNTEWYAQSANEASREFGDEIVRHTLEYLDKTIQ